MTVAVLFALFALLQVNDPDPLPWIFIYGVTSLYTAYSAVRTPHFAPYAVWAALCLIAGVWTIGSWDGSSQPMGGGGIFGEEVVREALGLGLAGLWMVIVAIRLGRDRKPAE